MDRHTDRHRMTANASRGKKNAITHPLSQIPGYATGSTDKRAPMGPELTLVLLG